MDTNYPYSYPISNRSTNISGYRYFFNGQEADNEVFGDAANFGYEFRQYDSRLGRWWSVDPKWSEYPGISPYEFCNGSPVMLMDPDGKTSYEVNGERRWMFVSLIGLFSGQASKVATGTAKTTMIITKKTPHIPPKNSPVPTLGNINR